MELKGNTLLITGGASGIGLGLALEFKALGNRVVVAGRSAEKLAHAKAQGLDTLTVDMTREGSVRELAAQAIAQFPQLNGVIHNAGIMVNEKLTAHDNSQIAADTVATNLMGPIVLTNALLPHFLKQKSALIMTVTSGLAFMPLAMTPTYCATKAAIHSYTQSLRFQLRETSVEVKELVPPYVRTSLMGERQASDANAMPLEDFVREVMGILRDDPRAQEIVVKNAQPLRTASHKGAGAYQEFFEQRNHAMLNARRAEWDAL